ncbi:MAG: aldehyde dehydrogenase family protein [Ignavibacteriales bacterium]|nr:aldehyde dehydrogenase family protein [Ignavibacteriales bacterium]
MTPKQFYIGGELQSGSTTSAIRNPYNNSEIAHVYQANKDQIEQSILSARLAFKITSQYSSYERSEILHSIVLQLKQRKEEFAQLITAEAGKPITFSRAEVDRAIATFDIAAEEAKRITGEVLPLDVTAPTKNKQGIVTRFPIGIIACISPFNFPLNLVAHKLAPAIASGNSFILKPPPQTPLTSLLLGEILLNSGLEKKTINILPTSNENAEMLVTDDRIAMLSFTGSAKVGWMLKQKAGKKKVILELGGNAGVIVDKTADLSHAVARCALGGFGYAGQVCIKVQRIVIHESVYDQFEKEFIETASKIVVGDPLDEKTIVGPMISENETKRVESWVNEAVSQGAKVLTGGTRNGIFYRPTVLTNVKPEMKVCSEEIFGPVVTLEKDSTIKEAVDKINNSKYGLQAGIFSNDFRNIQYAYKHLDVGGVVVNDYPTFRVDNMPYGGVKDSGFGREGVKYAIQEMTEPKLMVF